MEKGRKVVVTPRVGMVVFTVSVLTVELGLRRGRDLRWILDHFQKEDEAKKDQLSSG